MAEVSLNSLFHIEEHFEATILIIPWIEFITMPLTCLAFLIALYKGVKALTDLMQHNRKPD